MPKRYKRLRSKRRSKKLKKLTASAINRALMKDREVRDEALGKVITTSANSDWPVICFIPNSAVAGTTEGRVFFTPAYLVGLMGRAVGANDPMAALGQGTSPTENNIARFYKTWVKNQVRNVSLNPVEITVYDCIAKESVKYATGLANLMRNIFYAFYTGMASKYAAADVQATVRTMAEGIYGAVPGNDYGFLMKNVNVSPYDSDLFQGYWDIKTHKIVLQPGESYIWRVKGFKPFDYDANDTNAIQYDQWKGQTYFPIIKARGEVGLSSTGDIGYTTVNLAVHTKFGVRIYRKNAVAGKAIVVNAMNAPGSGTVILGPSEDVQVA